MTNFKKKKKKNVENYNKTAVTNLFRLNKTKTP